MMIPVLIATRTPGFGELVQQTLRESGRYDAVLVDSTAQALKLAKNHRYNAAIIDCDLEEGPLELIVGSLRELCPDIRVILVPPENDMDHPVVTNLAPDGFLTKPFYLPTLLDIVDSALYQGPGKKIPPFPSDEMEAWETDSAAIQPVLASDAASRAAQVPDWLQNVTRAAQRLTRLSLESAAQAALIVKNGELWAYAGHLSQPEAQELSKVAANFWAHDSSPRPGQPREGKTDLARFVRLTSTGGEYMLYATSLAGNMILALVFDAETPFNQIRTQAGWLARALASPPDWAQDTQKSKASHQLEPSLTMDREEDYDELSAPTMPFRPILDNVPPSDPEATLPTPLVRGAPRPTSKPDLSATMPSRVTPRGSMPAEKPAPTQAIPENYAETRPHIIAGNLRKVEPEPVTPAMSQLVYACMLIPRLPYHYLTGEVSAKLSGWAGQLCLAFGWRLEYISIRPEYFQWIVVVPPTTSPSYLMRIMRQHTSLRIFAEFNNLAQENPSGDFWAPGYLIISSSEPPPANVVKSFIQQTRRHQGLTNSPLTS